MRCKHSWHKEYEEGSFFYRLLFVMHSSMSYWTLQCGHGWVLVLTYTDLHDEYQLEYQFYAVIEFVCILCKLMVTYLLFFNPSHTSIFKIPS